MDYCWLGRGLGQRRFHVPITCRTRGRGHGFATEEGRRQSLISSLSPEINTLLTQRYCRNRHPSWWSSRRLIEQRRYVTVEAGENKTGHVNTAPSEALVYFDTIFPLKLQWLLRLPWHTESIPSGVFQFLNNTSAGVGAGTIDPAQIVEQTGSAGSSPVRVVSVIPRLKEGGAFVKFAFEGTDGRGSEVSRTSTRVAKPSSIDMEDATSRAAALERRLRQYLKKKRIRPWWNPLVRLRARLVRGRPWVEDMRRPPSSILHVDFLPASFSPDSSKSAAGTPATELSQEQIYALFRPYGLLADISIVQNDPKTSPTTPNHLLVQFAAIRKAITARNCMHGYLVNEAEGGGRNGTLLRLTYKKKVKGKWIRDWLFSHPRIVIPALAAILATVTVSVFDPIRSWFVKAHITRAFHVGDSRAWRWFKTQATDLFHLDPTRDHEASMGAIWDDQRNNIDEIRTWLMEDADTFIVVQGPRGSGKRELVVDQALSKRKYKLIIDCKPIQEARGDSATIRSIANAVGYRPIFSWMNSINSAIDLVAQSATGVKTGFSETLDGQASKILNATATALKLIAIEARRKTDKDSNLSDDEWLEAHPEKRPVVILDNFLHKSHDGGTVMYDKLAEWGARLTTANIAHVIFLTHDMSYSKLLSKALPNRLFRQISLSDCSPEVAKRYVVTQLSLEAGDDEKPSVTSEMAKSSSEAELAASIRSTSASSVPEALDESRKSPSASRSSSSFTPPLISSSNTSATTSGIQHENSTEGLGAIQELDEAVAMLGGRLTDLDYLARRIRAGETPKRAVRAIAEQSASEIQKVHLFSMGADEAVLQGLGTPAGQEQPSHKWTPEQAWVLIRMLAGMVARGSEQERLDSNEHIRTGGSRSTTVASTSEKTQNKKTTTTITDANKKLTTELPIHYHALLILDSLFGPGTGDLALASLAEAELIAIDTVNGRPAAIRPGRPIFAHACAALVADPVLSARMDLAVLSARIGKESGKVEKAEREIGILTGEGVLGSLGGGGAADGGHGDGKSSGWSGIGMFDRLASGRNALVKSQDKEDETQGREEDLRKRLRWLVKKIGSAQEKIEEWEMKGKVLKEVLKMSY